MRGPSDFDDPEFRNTGAPAGCILVVTLLLVVALLCSCAYTFGFHPSVEWLESVDEPSGYVVLANFWNTLACNHACGICVGIPFS